MNKVMTWTMAVLSAGSLFAVPVVQTDSVSMTQDASRKVTIRYRLTGEPGIVTIDIQTNGVNGSATEWASVGGRNLTHMFGDVNRLNRNVSSESVAYWQPDKAWRKDGEIADGGVRAVVTAWATNAPPDYMVANLQIKNDYAFYVDAESIPGGVQDRRYKTTQMIFRKVPAAGIVWRMGSPTTETNRSKGKDWAAYEPARLVKLSFDYYLGIYEVTAGQWDTACKASGNSWVRTQVARTYEGPDAEVCPLAGATYWCYRANIEARYRWPDQGYTIPNQYGLDSFRDATGLLIDFPTSAQWEYACRAGSGARFCYGEDASAADLGDYAWYSANASNAVHEVGLKKPNAWGFYDMHGNVAEWLREPSYYPSKDNPETPVTDPTIEEGSAATSTFSAGGSCTEGDGYLRSAARLNTTDRGSAYAGARLWASAVITY